MSIASLADPKSSDRHIAWTRAFAAAMTPHGAGGYFLNFLVGDEEDSTIRAAFGAKYDPETSSG